MLSLTLINAIAFTVALGLRLVRRYGPEKAGNVYVRQRHEPSLWVPVLWAIFVGAAYWWGVTVAREFYDYVGPTRGVTIITAAGQLSIAMVFVVHDLFDMYADSRQRNGRGE